ncbi:MAG: thioredoxin family protein [Thermodesulfobacteriota bacterium]
MTEVTRIRIGEDVAGIAGLKEALRDAAERCEGMPDGKIGEMLLEALSKRNYIYPARRELYRQAFLREYKKFIGAAVEEAPGGGINIKVFGQGCPRCRQLEEDVRTILAETGIDADLEHVSDLKEIMRSGIMGTPALMIGGKVLAAGSVPAKAKIREWIERAAGRKPA